jgi:hypothetical protein
MFRPASTQIRPRASLTESRDFAREFVTLGA